MLEEDDEEARARFEDEPAVCSYDVSSSKEKRVLSVALGPSGRRDAWVGLLLLIVGDCTTDKWHWMQRQSIRLRGGIPSRLS